MDPKEELITLIDVYAYKSLLSGKRSFRILGDNAIIILSLDQNNYVITLMDSSSRQLDIVLDTALSIDKKERLEKFLERHIDERWYCAASCITGDVIDKIINLLNDPRLFDESGVMTKAAR